jgi:hypothetical protein
MPKDFPSFLYGVAFLATMLSLNSAWMLLISFWIPLWQKCKNYGWSMLKLALVLFCASSVMMFETFFVNMARGNLAVGILFAAYCIAVIALSLFALFCPSYIAFREDRKLFWYVLPLNILSLQGNIWWALVLVWATLPKQFWAKLDKRVMGKRYRGGDAT